MPIVENTQSFGRKVTTFFKRLIIALIVLGLMGLAVFLLSQQNSRTFTLEVHDGKLTVMKGRMMPFGVEVWRPEPALVDAYAQLDLKGTQPFGVLNVKYGERDELDRALFTVIEGMAKPKAASDDPKDLDESLYLIRRGDRLAGLTEEQRLSLKTLKADVSFYYARLKLDEAQHQIEEAISQLKIATEGQNRHARSANQMLMVVEPEAKVMVDVLRKAVNALSQPAKGANDPAAINEPPPLPAPVPAPAPAPTAKP